MSTLTADVEPNHLSISQRHLSSFTFSSNINQKAWHSLVLQRTMSSESEVPAVISTDGWHQQSRVICVKQSHKYGLCSLRLHFKILLGKITKQPGESPGAAGNVSDASRLDATITLIPNIPTEPPFDPSKSSPNPQNTWVMDGKPSRPAVPGPGRNLNNQLRNKRSQGGWAVW